MFEFLDGYTVVLPRPKSSMSVKRSVERSSVKKLKLSTACSLPAATLKQRFKSVFRKLNCSSATKTALSNKRL